MWASFSFGVSVEMLRSHLYLDLMMPPFVHASWRPTGLYLLLMVLSIAETQWIVVPLSAIASLFLLFGGGKTISWWLTLFIVLSCKHCPILVPSRPCQVRGFPAVDPFMGLFLVASF